MKIQTLHHDPSLFAVSRAGGMTPVVRSSASHLHSFVAERERQRALNAAKLERMFAKPLVASLSGHTDGVSALARCRSSLAPILSGAYDGELIFWSASARRPVQRLRTGASGSVIRGITTSLDDRLVFAAQDRSIFAFALDLERFAEETSEDASGALASEAGAAVVRTYESSHGSANCVDGHWGVHEVICGTGGGVVEVFDPQRSRAKSVLRASDWERECSAVVAARYNASETHLVAATTQNCHVLLFDTRTGGAVSRVQLQGRGNCVSWNPREPMNLGVASEDCNAYVFDIRKLEEARQVHKGHVQAVTAIDFSPVGKEVVTGSYDKTVRIFGLHDEKAREVYFAKRMQRLAGVVYSGDGRFVLSASEDMNVRIWKNRAHEKLGVVCEREKKAIAYREKLKEKFGKLDEEVRTITTHRYVPKFIKNQGKQRAEMFASRTRKDGNKEKFQKGFVKQNDKQKIVRAVDQQL